MNKFKSFYRGILELYKNKSTLGMILLSLSFLLGFLWPIAGVTIYLITKISNNNREYGKMGILGATINIFVYILQIIVTIAKP